MFTSATWPFVLFGSLFFVVISLFIAQRWFRRQKWVDLAERMGFEYARDKSVLFPRQKSMLLATRLAEFSAFTPIKEERSPHVLNLIQREHDGIRIIIADVNYSCGDDDTVATTVCLVRTESLFLPYVYLRPRIWLASRIGTLFSSQVVRFEDDPVFEKKFVVEGEGEEDVRNILTPSVRQFLLHPDYKKMTIEVHGHALLLYTARRLAVTQESVQQRMQLAFLLMNELQGGTR